MKQPRIQESQREKFILIVEDDPSTGELLEFTVTAETPYLARWVQSAEAALHLISQRTPDLFLLDDLLPGMSGLELYDYLHTIPEFSTVPALLLSATRLGSGDVEGHHVTFLAKPYELETFLATIRSLLDGGERLMLP